MRRVLVLAAPLVAAAVFAGACGDDAEPVGPATDDAVVETLRVPGRYPTIQDAVDAAGPGDLVLVDEGVYHESVVVQTERIVLRGVDRNEVILDGRFAEGMENGIVVVADGVAVENLTVRNYRNNGVFFTGSYADDYFLRGYRASYVTVHNTGVYGLYGFNAIDGQFDHSYASGTDGAAFYVGQCNPCNALVTDVVGEYSGLGYSGTNSTGVVVASSEFRNNAIGVMPNSGDYEELAPNEGTTIVGNFIHDNDQFVTSLPEAEQPGLATGVVLAGTSGNRVERNLIVDNPGGGVLVVDWLDEFGGETTFAVHDNTVIDNVVAGSSRGSDLTLASSDPDARSARNCFSGNRFATSLPDRIESVFGCDATADTAEVPTVREVLRASYLRGDVVDPTAVPAPEYDFVSMPDARTAPPRPAIDVPAPVDIDAIDVPDR